MSYSEDQEKFQAKIGDWVKILCKASDNDPWCNEWTEGMDRFIGHTGVIVNISKTQGIAVQVPGVPCRHPRGWYRYPYSCLSLVR
jgi:hypothetical protein